MAIDPETGFLVNKTDASGKGTFDLDIDVNIDDNVGADQLGTLSFAASNGDPSGLASGGADIFLYVSVSDGGITLVGSTFSTGVNGDDASVLAAKVFTVTLNLDGTLVGTSDTYTFELFAQIDVPETFNATDAGFVFNGGNDPWAFFDSPDAGGDPDILLTPIVNGADGGTINSSAIAGGVSGGNSVGAGEAVRVDYVDDLGTSNPTKNSNPGTYANTDNQDHVFGAHVTVQGASVTFTNISSASTIRIAALDDLTTGVGGGSLDNITSITIAFNGAELTIDVDAITNNTTTAFVIGGQTFNVTNADNEVVVGGVLGNTIITTFTADGYNSIEYHYESGGTFKVGAFGGTTISPGATTLDFDLVLTDADGDFVLMEDALNIHLSPEGSTLVPGTPGVDNLVGGGDMDTLLGFAGDDLLSGGADDDILVGGVGDDTLTGGGGADTFLYTDDDLGLDTITDFVLGTDTIDIDGLVQGLGGDLSMKADTDIHFGVVGGNTIIKVDADGDGTLDAGFSITLSGVSLSSSEIESIFADYTVIDEGTAI